MTLAKSVRVNFRSNIFLARKDIFKVILHREIQITSRDFMLRFQRYETFAEGK